MQTMLYNNLSNHFRKKYGTRLGKICIDGGFTCPNRDGKCGTGGCIYCGECGAGEHIDTLHSIRKQTEFVLRRSKKDAKLVAYFQSFTNTYADVKTLRERYDAALIDERIVALAIGTRPDCIDEEKAKLLAEYNEKYDVWVELGLQTVNDQTAEIINRGYKTEVFGEAVRLLHKYGIEVVAHLIIGLPGEGISDAVKTADYIVDLGIRGIKIHSIYVMEGTKLADMYRQNLYTPPTLDEYTDAVVEIIKRLPEDMVIHRMTGDSPKELLIAPIWNSDKNLMMDTINEKLAKALGKASE